MQRTFRVYLVNAKGMKAVLCKEKLQSSAIEKVREYSAIFPQKDIIAEVYKDGEWQMFFKLLADPERLPVPWQKAMRKRKI